MYSDDDYITILKSTNLNKSLIYALISTDWLLQLSALENKSIEELNDYLNNNTVEGVYTLKSIYGLVKSKKIKMPFIDMVYDLVFHHSKPEDIISFLKEKQ